jgi:Fur family transcriptional regulator, stress-responsive regulator
VTVLPADVLREHGLQRTAQRVAVLKAVTSQQHATADEVLDIAEGDIGTISRQAVYDALNVLVENGLLRRIQPVGSPALYEVRVNDNHHHVVCRICGRVGDVDCAVGEAPCLTADNDLGFEIDEAEVVYWGRCPTCRAQGLVASRLEPHTDRRNLRSKVETPPS